MVKAYSEEHLTIKEIGELLGCNVKTVASRMREYDIPRRMGPLKQNWDLVLSRAREIVSTHDTFTLADALGIDRRALEYRMANFVEPRDTESIFDAFKRSAQEGTLDLSERIPISDDYKCAWCGEERTGKHRNDTRFCNQSCAAKWRHSRGSPRPRWNAWNEHIFDELTADGAYILGFIVADGSIADSVHKERGTKSYVIAIHQKDTDILHRIASALDYQGELFSAGNSSTKGLHLGSKYAWHVVTGKYGIPAGRTKSKTVRIPPQILESSSLLPHFIRGYFDGDGCIYVGYTNRQELTQLSFCSGSPKLLDDVVESLVLYANLSHKEKKWRRGGFIKKDGTPSSDYEVRWTSIIDIMGFAQFIYGPDLDVYGSDLYLQRKKEKFDQLFVPWRARDQLFQRFVVEGKSVGRIADEFGVNSLAITPWIKHYNLRQARSKHWNLELGI